MYKDSYCIIDENPSIGLITLITIPPIWVYPPTPADGRGSAWEEIFFTKTTSLARDQHIPFEINMEATSEAVDAVGDTLPSKKPQSLKLCCHWLLLINVTNISRGELHGCCPSLFVIFCCASARKKWTHEFAACCWLDRVERQILSKRMSKVPVTFHLSQRSQPDRTIATG